LGADIQLLGLALAHLGAAMRPVVSHSFIV